MYISSENILITFLLINALSGAMLGLRFSVFVVVPLVAVALLEARLLRTTWMSSLAWSAVLVCSLELGYLAGAALGAMRSLLPIHLLRRDSIVPGRR